MTEAKSLILQPEIVTLLVRGGRGRRAADEGGHR